MTQDTRQFLSLARSRGTPWEERLNVAVRAFEEEQFALAEELFRQVVEVMSKTLGPGHPEVAVGLDDLAEVYSAQGKHDDAEIIRRQCLDILEGSLGPEHLNVSACLNNLALSCQAQGKYAEAERLYKRAYHMAEKASGHVSTQVASCLGNLCSLYYQQERYVRAEKLCRECLKIQVEILGPEHQACSTSARSGTVRLIKT